MTRRVTRYARWLPFANAASLILVGLSLCDAAPPPPPISLNIRTAGDLAAACSTPPSNAVNSARLNFCTGFAQGVLQAAGQNPSAPKYCLPSPSPKRSDTMKEFATWVKADAARRTELASVSFLKFMAQQFPCKT